MRVECECGKPLKVSETLIGKRVRCPQCNSTLVVEAEHGIAAGRTQRAATATDPTPRPRNRRQPVEKAGSAAPSRKRGRDEEEEDRPRKKNPPTQSSGLPLLLMLGGAAALLLFVVLVGAGIGAYFLFVRGSPTNAPGAPASGAGGKGESVAVKFDVPSVVGDSYDFTLVYDETLNVTVDAGGKDRIAENKTANVRGAGMARVQAVDGSGRDAQSELSFSQLSMNSGQGDAVLLPPNAVVVREQQGRAPVAYRRKDGGALTKEALSALQEGFGKGGPEEIETDNVFGSKQKVTVGDTWPINRSALVQSFNTALKGTVVLREQDVSGTAQFTGLTTEAGISCLEFQMMVDINQVAAPANFGGVPATVNLTATMKGTYRIPADYSTPAIRETMVMNLTMTSTFMGPAGAGSMSIVQRSNKTATRKYASSGKKARADLGERPVDGMTRLELALSRERAWEISGVFAPLVGASVFKTGGSRLARL